MKKNYDSMLQRQRSSGLSVTDFCHNEGIAKSTFYYQQKKQNEQYHNNIIVPISIQSEVPVKASETSVTTQANIKGHQEFALEIIYPNGMQVRLKGKPSIDIMKTLLNV